MPDALLAPKVVVSSRVPLPRDELWARIGSLDGANEEMAPWLALRTSGPLRLDDAEAGVPLACRLRGPLEVPLGSYPLCFVRAPDASGFLEQTRAVLLDPWQHERTLSASDAGATVLTDSLSWRLVGVGQRPRAEAAVAAITRAFFEHRHRRLWRAVAQAAQGAPGVIGSR